MKKIILIFALAFSFNSNAQSFSDGVYNTNYGTINLTFEQGFEYPNGGIVYGDYKGIGTITGSTANVGKEIIGNFHNGAAEGKFIFFSPSGKQHFFDSGITSFNGNWGYGTDNKYSTNPDYIWKVTSKAGGSDAVKNVTNVWSGKWNTTQGYIILQQVGNKVTGKYHDVGNIDATYNPSTKKLTGTFTNNGKKGYLEYSFEGNSFKGKWGWTTALSGGNWDGTKHVKNNKVITSSSTSTSNNQNSTTIQQGLTSDANPSNNSKKVTVKLLHLKEGNGVFNRFPDLYGIVSVDIIKVTQNSSESVNSFGNKSKYLLNSTEDYAFRHGNDGCAVPNSPQYTREYNISSQDWNDRNIKFEIRITHHIKGKINGPNQDYEKYTEVFDLKTIPVDGSNNIWVGYNYKNGNYVDYGLEFDKSRVLFKIIK